MKLYNKINRLFYCIKESAMKNLSLKEIIYASIIGGLLSV